MDEHAAPIRVLHVDDEPGLGETVATFLERADARLAVETATDADEGLECVFERDVDCVVSDYDMSGTNGIEFLEAVRAAYPDLPFVLYTGKGSEEVASEAISAGVTDYLQKEAGTDQYAVLANRITNAVEHHRSQQRVERSEQRLRDVIDTLPHLLYVVDAEGTYRLANEALADFHGTTVDDIERSHVSDVLGESMASGFMESVETVLDAGTATRFDSREITDSTGETRVFEPLIRPYEYGDSDTETVLGIAADVTDRTAHERELRQKERRYQAVFNDPNILVGLLDTDGYLREVNETAMDYVDAGPADVTDRPLWETPWFAHDASVQADVRQWIDRAAAGEYVDFRTEHPRRAGTPTTVDGAIRPVTDDDTVVSLLITSRDITEQRERERAIEALHDTATDILQSENEEAVATVMVDAMADVLGMPLNGIFLYDDAEDVLRPAEISERGPELLDEIPTFHPGDSLAWSVFETGETRHFDDVSTVTGRHNPDTVIRSEMIVPIGDRGIAMVGSTEPNEFDSFDVSLVETLASHAETAFDRIDRERELERQNERLDEFASVVSHDIRNPLSAAIGYLDLAREECETDHLDRVADAHGRIETLIDDVLAMARESDQADTTERVELATAVATCWESVAVEPASLRVDATGRIEARPSRLKRLLENLFRNAIEHGGDDVTVTVERLPGGFAVEDDGPGMPADAREAAFDVGFSTAPSGNGLGLRIVRDIADAHGWDIRVTEGRDGGARFEITGVDWH